MTKVMVGVFKCVLAYDTYFQLGARKCSAVTLRLFFSFLEGLLNFCRVLRKEVSGY